MVRFAFPLYTKDLWASHLKYPLSPSPPKTNNGDSDQPAQRGGPEVSNLWRDIQGVNSWKGLLDPMNPILKAEILRYGEFAQLCYDAFDDRDYSEYYGTCKHSKRSLFQKLGLPHSGYQVTKYLYANTGVLGSSFGYESIDNAVWIGFIAVCTDPNEIERLGRRDIVIAWRGTRTAQEWMQNFKDILVPLPPSLVNVNVQKNPDPNVRIEKGFLSCYTSVDEGSEKCSRSARDIVVGEITRLVKQYKDERLSITLTGHSLGAALATLSAYDVKETAKMHSMQLPIPVTVFAFASPGVGNQIFAQRMEEIGVKVLRMVNKHDVVPNVPGLFMNENMGWLSKLLNWLPWTYFHVGIQLSLHNDNSPFLKPTHNLSDFHSLEVYLHLLDGYDGENKSFKSSGRDPALVNKSCDLLIDSLHIPSHWWHEGNKGLVKSANGKWTWPARSPRSPDAYYDPHEI
jgi:hypothetical protein